MRMTRLAPSPTGALHLGNARTFLINWLMARQQGWSILLRIEDIDAQRAKPGSDQMAIDDLHWLGMDWDRGPIYQLPRLHSYRQAIARLLQSNNAYPCVCTRREVELAASAPHASDGTTRYPGLCRGRFESFEDAQQFLSASGDRSAPARFPAVRFLSPGIDVQFDDGFSGTHVYNMTALGDFVLAKSDGGPAYQLAVVVDDAEMQITDVVRSDDLLDSTPRQICVYRALNMMAPRFWHVPLVVGEDGRRLAKRHGDSRIASYREAGVPAARVLTLLARWCGIDRVEPQRASDLLPFFDLAAVPRQAITFTRGDQSFLTEGMALA